MAEPIKISVSKPADRLAVDVNMTIDDLMVHKSTATAVLREIIVKVAQRYVEEMYPVIVRSLDAQAIANLAIAEAGAQIAKSVKESSPERVLVVEKPAEKEVYQRGILGGLKRIR